MANNKFPYTSELTLFQTTDDEWGRELVRIFGKQAGQARYEPRGRGEKGTTLRRLHDARENARRAWHASAT